MALASTSLSRAVTVADKSIVVASATSFAAGRIIRIDNELMEVASSYSSGTTIPVLKGRNGTAVVAHPITAEVIHGLASDFAAPVPQTNMMYPNIPATIVSSYSADGAIALPSPGSNALAILNAVSSTVLAMTVANPTAEMDGCRLVIGSRNGTGAHTITFASGLNGGGSGYDVFTFPAGPVFIEVIAYNEVWNAIAHPAWTGTVTLLVGGIA